jgi:membrane protein YqaA with SNARE-associated domain
MVDRIDKPNLIRRLYDWVLSWADTPWGPLALFLLAFAEASFFPIPPDVLLLALALGATRRAFRFALIATAGSVLGGALGYYIGYELWYNGAVYSGLANYFFDYIPGFHVERFEAVRELYNQHGFWVVFTAGFTPIPYKIFTIMAGLSKINLATFMIASAISRAGRFFLVAAMIYFLGERVRVFIDRWFNLVTIAFMVLLIGGFILVSRF